MLAYLLRLLFDHKLKRMSAELEADILKLSNNISKADFSFINLRDVNNRAIQELEDELYNGYTDSDMNLLNTIREIEHDFCELLDASIITLKSEFSTKLHNERYSNVRREIRNIIFEKRLIAKEIKLLLETTDVHKRKKYLKAILPAELNNLYKSNPVSLKSINFEELPFDDYILNKSIMISIKKYASRIEGNKNVLTYIKLLKQRHHLLSNQNKSMNDQKAVISEIKKDAENSFRINQESLRNVWNSYVIKYNQNHSNKEETLAINEKFMKYKKLCYEKDEEFKQAEREWKELKLKLDDIKRQIETCESKEKLDDFWNKKKKILEQHQYWWDKKNEIFEDKINLLKSKNLYAKYKWINWYTRHFHPNRIVTMLKTSLRNLSLPKRYLKTLNILKFFENEDYIFIQPK